MFRRTVSGIMFVLLMISMLTLSFRIQPAKAATIIVPDQYVTIQAAIDAASAGDTIQVKAGTYSENVVVNKRLSLQGAGWSTTVVQAVNPNVTVFSIFADYVTLTGFTARNASGYDMQAGMPGNGVLVFGNYTNILDNCFENNYHGIFLLYSWNSIVSRNHIVDNFALGIYLHSCSKNVIFFNDVSGCDIGIDCGPYSNLNVISNNIVTGNDVGIELSSGSYVHYNFNNTISFNNISLNSGGIMIEGCESSFITSNILLRNEYGALSIHWSNFTYTYHNNFIENVWFVRQVSVSWDSYNSRWDDGYPSGGNYWSDYNGTDANGDGIGDTPYVPDSNNTDHYPLMTPLDFPTPAYNVTIVAHCNIEGVDKGVTISEDGTPTGFSTPFTFTNLTGFHMFTVATIDADGHPFKKWNSGEISPTIIVGSDGTYTAIYDTEIPLIRVPEEYSSIQAAIDAASPWSTILIGPGVYNESVIINKPLHIIGKLGSEPIWSGGGSGKSIITVLSSASGFIVEGIVCTSWEVGILINNASKCTIYKMTFAATSDMGIVVEGNGAVGNIICNNLFQNSNVAIDSKSSSYNNTLYRNIIDSCNVGIKLESCGNLVFANTIAGCSVGIDLSNSNSNVIYHNNLVNNTAEVSVSTSAGNTWDNGYPSGGNYWSNSVHADVYGGPLQNQPGSDGIVDTPYTVAGSDVDRYPLAQPFNAHDVGIVDYAMSKTVVGAGYGLRVEVKILNYGVYDENFLVTTYANTSKAVEQLVTLTKSNCIIITLTWNTSGFAHGNYTMTACAGTVQDESDTSNNNCTCNPSVHVGVPGDVSSAAQGVYDRVVNMRDISYLILLFNTKPAMPKWNPNTDINNDATVNMRDISIAILNFNKHE